MRSGLIYIVINNPSNNEKNQLKGSNHIIQDISIRSILYPTRKHKEAHNHLM